MSTPVITVENLSKRYTLRHQARSGLLRDKLASILRNPFGQLRAARATAEEFWALSDVSFAVNQGDVLGIIGRNGAGKSTLLKILSRITEPTTGRIAIQGRVASLLEVGTGFHGELSGRENIFLNGAILGMKRVEIRKKFDEIVAFAEVEKFLDTPVKHYSSGMYVRLAFAVAAHLEPEILIVDEVLAVGDTDFQRKCLLKMDAVTQQEGRTILFVSHQLASVRQLCKRVLVLRSGQVAADTSVEKGIAHYLASNAPQNERSTKDLGDELRLIEMTFDPNPTELFSTIAFSLKLQAKRACHLQDLCLLFYNEQGQRAAIVDLRQQGKSYEIAGDHEFHIAGSLQRVSLVPGKYEVGLFIRTHNQLKDYLGLRMLDIKPQPGKSLLSYASEHLGLAAIETDFTAKSAD